MGAQGLSQRRMSPDLSVGVFDYFGAPVEDLKNANSFGLIPEESKDLYRVQYLYLMVFGNEQSSTDYGGIQVRSSTYLYLEDGRVPVKFQRVMQRCAHRGAHAFDSSLGQPGTVRSKNADRIYGGGGGEWGDGGGYLSGFTPVENGADYRNWEVEPVGSAQGKPSGAQPGVIRWTTEVYLEVEGTKYADLSGVGQGIADPYHLTQHDVPPKPPEEAQQTWWEVTFNQAKGSYDIHPPGDTASKERAKQLHGKDVYLNGLKIGTVTTDGRVWLKKEYQNGSPYRGRYSKSAITRLTAAKPQSIRGTSENPGKIAKVDESPGAVHLGTKQFRPDDWDPVDADDVDPFREVEPGSPGETVYLLSLPEDVEDATRQEVRQDQEIDRHLGYSNPPYSDSYSQMWAWPGFRSIVEHGRVRTPGPDEDGQGSLGDYGGGA